MWQFLFISVLSKHSRRLLFDGSCQFGSHSCGHWFHHSPPITRTSCSLVSCCCLMICFIRIDCYHDKLNIMPATMKRIAAGPLWFVLVRDNLKNSLIYKKELSKFVTEFFLTSGTLASSSWPPALPHFLLLYFTACAFAKRQDITKKENLLP